VGIRAKPGSPASLLVGVGRREPFYFPGSKSTPGKNPFPKRESPKNKSRIRGVFFNPKTRPSIHHEITTIPPQIHHQKTTFYHPFSPKPPAKTQKTSLRKKHHLEREFESPFRSTAGFAPRF
jgi:hypothetical protein